MKKFILILIIPFIFAPLFAFAQEDKIPKETLEELSKDLEMLHKQVVVYSCENCHLFLK